MKVGSQLQLLGHGPLSDSTLLGLVVEDQRLNIAGTVYHTNDDYIGIGETVIQHVITVEVRPKAFGQMVTVGADLRMREDG